MTDDFRTLIARVEQLPEAAQRVIAQLIAHELERAQWEAALPTERRESYAGAWADLPEDDEFETLDRMRHSSAPTPPMDEQLHWLDEE